MYICECACCGTEIEFETVEEVRDAQGRGKTGQHFCDLCFHIEEMIE